MDPNQSLPLFLLSFVGLWLFMSGLFAVISGWFSLAQDFKAMNKPAGEKITGQVKQFGIVPENRVTHMVLSNSGLYLDASVLFRFMHPPLLIPWSRISAPSVGSFLWSNHYNYDLASLCSIRVTERAHHAIERFRSQLDP